MTEQTVAEATPFSTQNMNLRWTWQHIENALRDLQFGSITLVVQDGVVVQVERTERKRFERMKQTEISNFSITLKNWRS